MYTHSAGFLFGRALGQAAIQDPSVKIEANDVVKPHSMGSRGPLNCSKALWESRGFPLVGVSAVIHTCFRI